MKRIAVIGSCGAGKSTFARQLGLLLNIQVLHLDVLCWKPGWVMISNAEQITIQERLIQQDSWIFDGNYGSTLDIRVAAADTIIFLDFPRVLCLYRALKRRVQYAGKSRPDMAAGCAESIDWEFLRWIWNYPAKERPKVTKKLQQYAEGRQIIILHTPRQVKQFLQEVKTAKPKPGTRLRQNA